MSTNRPYAFNTGTTINGTMQVGNIAIGIDAMDYSTNPGGVKWWMGPDEDLGIVFGIYVPEYNHSTPVGNIAGIQFWRSRGSANSTVLSTINLIARKKGQSVFNNIDDARNWLTLSGYSASWVLVEPLVEGISMAEGCKLYGLTRNLHFKYTKKTQIGIINNFEI
jgi:hypothetical protein